MTTMKKAEKPRQKITLKLSGVEKVGISTADIVLHVLALSFIGVAGRYLHHSSYKADHVARVNDMRTVGNDVRRVYDRERHASAD